MGNGHFESVIMMLGGTDIHTGRQAVKHLSSHTGKHAGSRAGSYMHIGLFVVVLRPTNI